MVAVASHGARHVPGTSIERLNVSAHEIPTDGPGGKESDGTLEWESTTIVVVQAEAGGETGLGYTYGDASVAKFVDSQLAELVEGSDPLSVRDMWRRMGAQIRNAGRPGVGAMAVSAVDTALWDLKARLLGIPLVDALDRAHDAVPVYASGGFCNYPPERLREQLGGWVEDGIPRVKLKVGRDPSADPAGSTRRGRGSGTRRSCTWTRTVRSRMRARGGRSPGRRPSRRGSASRPGPGS